MKKLFIYSFFAGLLLTFMFSCNKQESTQPTINNEKQEMAALMVALDNYNATYFQDKVPASLRSNIPTRGSRSIWNKFIKVLRADAYGALCGLLFGGWGAVGNAALSSALACIELDAIDLDPIHPMISGGGLSPNGDPVISHEDDLIDMQITPIHLNYALENTVFVSQIPDCVDSVGFYHNKILWQINIDSLMDISENGIDTMISAICIQAEELTNNGRNGTTIAQLLQGVNFYQLKNAYENPINSLCDDSLRAAYITLFPEYEDEFDFIDNVVEALGEIDPEDNDGTYITGVLTLIRNSNLSTATKKRLGAAVITGNASSLLWNID